MKINPFIAEICKDDKKDVVKRLDNLFQLKYKVTGYPDEASQASIKFKIREYLNLFDVIKIRESEEQLEEMRKELDNYTDLC
jgi:predicted MarR family transcription regulator